MPLPRIVKPTEKQIIEYVKKVNRIPTLKEVADAYKIERTTMDNYWSAKKLEEIAFAILKGKDINAEYIDRARSLEQENTWLKKEVDRLNRMTNLEQRMLEIVEDKAGLMPKPEKVARRVVKPATGSEEALLILSDLHFPEVVNIAEMRGLNEYNTQIGVIRLQYLVNSVLRILDIQKRGGRKITRLNVAMLGDMVTGDIHEDLQKTNESPTLEAALLTASILNQVLREFASEYDVRVFGVAGNHGRLTKKTQYKKKYNNLDWLTYKIIELSVRDMPNIVCEFSKALFEIKEIQGVSCAFSHGDDIQSTWGIPYYGISKKDSSITGSLLSVDERYKYHFMGHFHHHATQPRAEGMIIVNPSLKGPDEYSFAKLGRVFPPMQLLFGLHNDKGLSFSYPIDLRPAVKNIKPRDIRYKYTLEDK